METSAQLPTLSLAADFYNRYPGELITYFVHFGVQDIPGVALQLSLPKVMQVISSHIPGETLVSLRIAETEQELLLTLALRPTLEPDREYVLEVQARIQTFPFDQHLLTEAILLDADTHPLARESIQVAVWAKSKSLQYLPEIYYSDDFTSRFLALAESFWKPISQQIDQVAYYFDANLTPVGFLLWLLSWVGLRVDMELPASRVRMLLQKGVALFQYRGTLYGLKTYLEIITTGQVQIREQRASNFILGKRSALGVEIALGSNNRPHAIAIYTEVPEAELERLGYTPEMYQRKIAAIVHTLIPAHISCELKCAFAAAAQAKEQA